MPNAKEMGLQPHLAELLRRRSGSRRRVERIGAEVLTPPTVGDSSEPTPRAARGSPRRGLYDEAARARVAVATLLRATDSRPGSRPPSRSATRSRPRVGAGQQISDQFVELSPTEVIRSGGSSE